MRITTEDGNTETPACVAASKQATVMCQQEHVIAAVRKGKGTRAHAAWRCSVTKGVLGETPVPWVAGDTTCLESKADLSDPLTFVEC